MPETLNLQPPSTAELQPAGQDVEHMALVGQATQAAQTMELTSQPNPEAAQTFALEEVAEEVGDTAVETGVVKPPIIKVQELLEDAPVTDTEGIQSYFRISREQAEAAIANAEVMQPVSRIAINLPRYGLEGLLTEGRKKSQYETGHGGTGSIDTRTSAEKRLGTHPEAGEEDVMYGYLTDISQERRGEVGSGTAGNYGDATIVLRPEVTERSTYTVGDSINPSSGSGGSLMGFESAVRSEAARQIAQHTPEGRRETYVEAQVQGGVRLEDIESITVDARRTPGRHEVNGEQGWQDEASIKELITDVQAKAPGVPLTIRVPARFNSTSTISAELTDIIDQHPEVTFVLVLDAPSPYRTSQARAGEHPGVDSSVNEEIVAGVTGQYEQSKALRDKLEESIPEYWAKKYGEGKTPENLKVQLSGHKE